MSSSSSSSSRRDDSSKLLPYPHHSFDTQILPADPEEITFSSSAATVSDRPLEPLRHAKIALRNGQTARSLDIAATALVNSLPVAFPTETVYGLAANALSTDACQSIFDAKGRPQDNPLIVHISDLRMAEGVTSKGWHGPRVYEELMKAFWPGGITFLVPAARADSASITNGNSSASAFFVGTGSSLLPPMVTAGHPLVGIRMPSHPLARALIAKSGLPLAAPSANASGRPSPTTAQHVMYDLGGQLDVQRESSKRASSETPVASPRGRIPYILDGGPSSQGVESTVVDGVTQPGELRILRPGAVGPEAIEDCLRSAGLLLEGEQQTLEAEPHQRVQLRVYGRDMARHADMEANPTTPGMKYRHYSPTAPVVLFVPSKQDDEVVQRGEHWRKALRREVEELVASQAVEQPGRPSVKVGMMLLVDSPLADDLFDTASSEEVRTWVQEEKSRENEAGACLGPAFELPLWDGDETASSRSTAVEIVPFSLGTLSQPDLPARRLFSGLRILDEASCISEGGTDRGVDLIVVEAVQERGIGLAVMNRLAKAAGGTIVVRTGQTCNR